MTCRSMGGGVICDNNQTCHGYVKVSLIAISRINTCLLRCKKAMNGNCIDIASALYIANRKFNSMINNTDTDCILQY